MNDFEKELIVKIGAEHFAALQAVQVGIAGCGGLGSNCAMHLARSGFKKLTIVDFDTVQLSNLNRQFYFMDQVGMYKTEALGINLKRINPDIELYAHTTKIQADTIEEIFCGCDIVVEAFDAAAYKSMLVERLSGKKRLLVCASGICGWGHTDAIQTRFLKNNVILIGDLITDCNQKPPFAPRVALAAAKQADAVLHFVLSA